jgi:uncharacterized Fe-S cluster protein YjdI/CDGSH-type Zn-finger protein
MTDPDIPAVPPRWGRAYTAPDITVYYDLGRCIHFAACIRGLPQVFDAAVRPWIQADNAPAEAVADVVRRCPTGALHYRLEHGSAEMPQPSTTALVVQNGPLFLRGELTIEAASGPVHDTRAALCRCGASTHTPFCDGTHRKIGFQAEGIIPTDHD